MGTCRQTAPGHSLALPERALRELLPVFHLAQKAQASGNNLPGRRDLSALEELVSGLEGRRPGFKAQPATPIRPWGLGQAQGPLSLTFLLRGMTAVHSAPPGKTDGERSGHKKRRTACHLREPPAGYGAVLPSKAAGFCLGNTTT